MPRVCVGGRGILRKYFCMPRSGVCGWQRYFQESVMDSLFLKLYWRKNYCSHI